MTDAGKADSPSATTTQLLRVLGRPEFSAVAAAIGRKKYGASKFQKYAAAGKKMRGVAPQ